MISRHTSVTNPKSSNMTQIGSNTHMHPPTHTHRAPQVSQLNTWGLPWVLFPVESWLLADSWWSWQLWCCQGDTWLLLKPRDISFLRSIFGFAANALRCFLVFHSNTVYTYMCISWCYMVHFAWSSWIPNPRMGKFTPLERQMGIKKGAKSETACI